MDNVCHRPDYLVVYCDGGIGGTGQATGLGVVIRDEQNEVIGLVKKSLPGMTNNEAEYAALILALEVVQRFQPRALHVYLDSEVVVGQMQGRFAVNSPALRRWHAQACRLISHYPEVIFYHIPRAANRLADALANEALTESEKR
jgi:probable phosphoglycerate mutase